VCSSSRSTTKSVTDRSKRSHKERLGEQDYTWVGEFRFWVWETSDWRVYANNHKGTCFEVREDLTDEEAFAAWDDYLQRVDVLNKPLSPEQELMFLHMPGMA